MAEGEKYLNKTRNHLTNNQVIRSLIHTDANGKPFFSKLEFECPVVTGLINFFVTYNSINIEWVSNSSGNYDIYYGPTPLIAPNKHTIPTATSTTNSYTAIGLTSLTQYSFYVRSNCGVRKSNWSGPLNVTTVDTKFIFTIDTTKTGSGSSSSTQFTLALRAGQTYNALIEWGDGTTTNQVTSTSPTHTYSTSGIYQVKVSGTFPSVNVANSNSNDKLKWKSINNWGSVSLNTVQSGSYNGCSNLNVLATDRPNISTAGTSMSSFFMGCTSLNFNINSWDASKFLSTVQFFQGCTLFNGEIGRWTTSNITAMDNMFALCSAFNKNIGNWNVSSATSMSGMFIGASVFNQNINSWNVLSCINMAQMFQSATAFNQPLNNWNTSNVVSLSNTFAVATSFNGDISTWNTIKVTDFSGMFDTASAFNQNIGSWNTSAATTMARMFLNASAFNRNIGSWNVSKVTTMGQMFQGALTFNQDIGSWNVSKVINMVSMFGNAPAFNQNIGSWDVSKVTSLNGFMGTKTPATFSVANLDAIYNGWSSRPVIAFLTPTFGTAKYSAASSAGRAILTSAPNNWTITDGGI